MRDVRVWIQQLVSLSGVVSGCPPGELSRMAEEESKKQYPLKAHVPIRQNFEKPALKLWGTFGFSSM
jgi:hypothetical protein